MSLDNQERGRKEGGSMLRTRVQRAAATRDPAGSTLPQTSPEIVLEKARVLFLYRDLVSGRIVLTHALRRGLYAYSARGYCLRCLRY
eukprot:3884478-Rhodomonas_salina.2